MYCTWCGWGKWLGDCATVDDATRCKLNRENIRRYMLQHRPEHEPTCVFSSRYQGSEGKGDSFHRLTISIDTKKAAPKSG
jgi:hypothetical protein